MKLAKRILLGAMAAFTMVGCNDDKVAPNDPNQGLGPDSEDGVFISVDIQMPTTDSSRSYTDDDNHSNSGTEVGQDYENNVNTVYLVLARKTEDETTNNAFIAWGEIPGNKIIKGNSSTEVYYNTTAKFSKSDIAAYYNSLKADDTNRDINVFVFCNPTLSLREILTEQESLLNNSWVNETAKYVAVDPESEIIWSENDFLMSNIAIATRTLPNTLEDWNAYTVETNPFDLSDKNPEIGIDNSIGNVNGARGPIKVERTAARFDFKDGSPDFDGKGEQTNTYQVIFDEWTNSAGEEERTSYINIKLTKMSFINMAKEFYYLRRVTYPETPLDYTKIWLCGPEKPWYTSIDGKLNLDKKGNYVVGPNAAEMLSVIKTDFSDYYNYPCFNATQEIDDQVFNNWYTSVIDDVLKGTKDNYDKKQYHIWRYSTENSIPNVGVQKNGQTTGVVFKGKMLATQFAANNDDKNIQEIADIINNKDGKLTGNPNNDPTLYLFAGRLYATWQNVEQAAKEAAIVPVWEADNNNPDGGYWRLEINRGNTLFHAVFGSGSCGEYTFKDKDGHEYTAEDPIEKEDPTSANALWHKWDDAKDALGNRPGFEDATTIAFKEAATANNFTLYQTSIDGTDGIGYYCYYYYWNRHNDNGQNGVMGPMEFCVVRNNVYKLSVTNINKLGHPRHSINDPNPPTPETDDEIDDVYITVQVEVLPWVVRINNIQF